MWLLFFVPDSPLAGPLGLVPVALQWARSQGYQVRTTEPSEKVGPGADFLSLRLRSSSAWVTQQRSCDQPIDVPALPTLPDTNLRYHEAAEDLRQGSTGASGLTWECEDDTVSPFVPGRAVWSLSSCDGSSVVRSTSTIRDGAPAGDPGSNPALSRSGHVTTRSMSSQRLPMLTFEYKRLFTWTRTRLRRMQQSWRFRVPFKFFGADSTLIDSELSLTPIKVLLWSPPSLAASSSGLEAALGRAGPP